MTRPMPGPPECDPQASPHESVPFNGGDFPTCDRHDPKRRYRKSKRLTDAECAAEYWREQAEWWVGMHQKGPTAEGVDIRRAVIWERFATHPHALEEA